MTIGILVFDTYSRWGKKKWIKMREHGFDCADYGMMETESGIYRFLSNTELETFVKEERQRASEAGIAISQVHGPWRYPPVDTTEEQRCERMEKMKRSLYAASLLGAPNWVIHPLMPFGINDVAVGRSQETREINLEFLFKLAQVGRECGVTICLENMPFGEFSLSTPAQIINIIREISHPNLKVCLDTGHAAIFEGKDLGDTVRLLGKNLQTLHIHDNDGHSDQHLCPYKGIIDWKGVAIALREIGFEGCFSLETHPSLSLPDLLFEDECMQYRKIAQSIIQRKKL